MKKYFSVVLMALCSLTVCAKEQVITFDQVPEPAKAIVAAHFDASQIAYVTLDRGLLDTDYEVKFNDGRSLEFNKAGELTKVDCKQTEVPLCTRLKTFAAAKVLLFFDICKFLERKVEKEGKIRR